MFQGASQLLIDTKGRMAIPVKHRDALAGSNGANQLVITAHPDRCLLLYPAANWEPILAKLLAFPSLDAKASVWRRMLVGYADTTELDSAGRILLPPALRQFANIEKNMMLIGQGNYFEIWNEAAWHEHLQSLDRSQGGMPAGTENFSL